MNNSCEKKKPSCAFPHHKPRVAQGVMLKQNKKAFGIFFELPTATAHWRNVCVVGGLLMIKVWSGLRSAGTMCFASLKEAQSNLYTKPWKFRISFRHMDITAREFLTKRLGEKNRTPKQTTWRHLSELHFFHGYCKMNKHRPVCMNAKIFLQGNWKPSVPGRSSLVMSWLDSGHGRRAADDMKDTEGRPCHARPFAREMKQPSLSRAFNPAAPWVKTSTVCQLFLTLNLSSLLPNTYTSWVTENEGGGNDSGGNLYDFSPFYPNSGVGLWFETWTFLQTAPSPKKDRLCGVW